jgi:hypothetical protein
MHPRGPMYIGFYVPNEFPSNSHGVSMKCPKGSLRRFAIAWHFYPVYAFPKLSSSHIYRWGRHYAFFLENNINFFFFWIEPQISFCDGPIKMAHWKKKLNFKGDPI